MRIEGLGKKRVRCQYCTAFLGCWSRVGGELVGVDELSRSGGGVKIHYPLHSLLLELEVLV